MTLSAINVKGCGIPARFGIAPVCSGSGRRTARRIPAATSSCAVLERVGSEGQQLGQPRNSIVPAPNFLASSRAEQIGDQRQVFVTLAEDVASTNNPEALRVCLKALRYLGISGVVLQVWWGDVEPRPQQYRWDGYRAIVQAAHDAGLKVKADIHFHANASIGLPEWVQQVGEQTPDIFYTDKAGKRYTSCLTLGVDSARVLHGRTGLEAYGQLLSSFREHFCSYMGSTITGCNVGLGPAGELRYPSHPDDGRWSTPGIGEFQCYDAFMLSSLRACAHQVQQPVWGLCGPHDSGTYNMLPQETGFFHHNGNWQHEYGRFFLLWYSQILTGHAEAVLGTAAAVFAGSGVALTGKLPLVHWWHGQAAHAAELTAGIYNTAHREGYLPLLQVFARHGVGVRVPGAELRNTDYPQSALCDPERLLLQIRTAAAALQLPVAVESSGACFDDAALARLEQSLADSSVNCGITVPPPQELVCHGLVPEVYEPANWAAFRNMVRRLRDRQEQEEEQAAIGAALQVQDQGEQHQLQKLQKLQQRQQEQQQKDQQKEQKKEQQKKEQQKEQQKEQKASSAPVLAC